MRAYQDHFNHKLTIYRQAMDHSNVESVLIDSGFAATAFRDDLDYPYKANPYFKEWLAIGQNQNAFLLLGLNSKPTLYLHRSKDYWHSSPNWPDDSVLAHFEVIEFSEHAQLSGLNKGVYIGELGVASNPHLRLTEPNSIEENSPQLLNYIDYHRAWKSDYELEQMRAANHLAVIGHRAAELAFQRGDSELEIHLAYLNAMIVKEAELPYDSIVALNQNAAVLHHMLLSGERPRNQLSLLIDAGASVAGYAADISRTYAINPETLKNSKRKSASEYQAGLEVFSQIANSLDTEQKKLVDMVVQGTDYVDIHKQSHRAVARVLVDLKIVNCSAEQAFESGLTRVFLPHGVGHLLGVQVHDRGGHMVNANGDLKPPPTHYPALRCTRIIEENMVFTIEPGLYFIPQLLAEWEHAELLNQTLIEQLLPFGGVRIEDNVVATKGAPENMTRDAFKSEVP